MKSLSARLLVFVVAATLLIPHASAQVVEILDPNLESAIREALELPDTTAITQQEMLKLERLDAGGSRGITDLTGLEYATNLEFLALSVNEIRDITPLAGLIKLESLRLRKNPITDLTPLANLTNLTYIHLGHVKASDITPLANLTKLEQARLNNMQLQDITPLANLTQLTRLSVAANQIVDISPLANLTQLEELWLDNNRIVDVSPLANLTALKELQIDRNQVVAISPLANLTQLTDLTIAHNPITDFSPLLGLNLQNVDIDIHKSHELASIDVEIPDPNLERAIRETLALSDAIPITQLEMVRLEKLTAKEAQIENITGLEHAINLGSLALSVNNIQDITPLAGLVNLDSLILRDNPIADLSPLANLASLTYLNLSGVVITDLTPLSNLTQLREFHAIHCHITDITPLANLNQLVLLNLRANQIVDVTPLTNLTQLETLWISENRIVDFTPLQGLSPTDFQYDEECLLPDSPIQDRIQNRSLPSIAQSWGSILVNLPHLARADRVSYHNIYWGGNKFGLRFESTPQGVQLKGDIDRAIAKRDELLSRNPNMLFLPEIRQRAAKISDFYPEDWPYWLRDNEGNLISNYKHPDQYFINMTLIEVQDIIVEQAVAVAKCGLFDGIFFDWWLESGGTLRDFSVRPAPFFVPPEAERDARLSILQRIRANVPDDFLILCNASHRKMPISAPYINGSFMETDPDDLEGGYTRDEIVTIETNLIWLEKNLQEPQINCLRAEGIPTEPHESPTNRRLMRFFTTMSLTLTDGYATFFTGLVLQKERFWYPFYDANLGQPIGPKAKRYQSVPSLYIREFTNGWAVYNQSGKAQTITLPSSATPVSDRGNNAASITHLLPDLDGEIYLKAPNPADVNGDRVVDILDLILVANSFGTSVGDVNQDGTTNMLDLTLVAQQFSQ